MSNSLHYLAAALLLHFAISCTSAQAGQTVWISPNDPTRGGAEDFWDLAKAGSPWQKAKGRIGVLEISQNLVTNGPPDKLREFYTFLKENHISLAIGIGMLTWTDQCGKHVEGYVPPGGSAYVAKRIKNLGGELAFIDVDEAVQFGRYYNGPNACHASLSAIADEIADNFAAYKQIFPEVRLGETEIFSPHPDRPNDEQFLSFTQNWLNLIKAKIGAPLAFYHQDVIWSSLSPKYYVPKLSALMRQNHVPFGVILIASNGNGPDAAWMESVKANIRTVKALPMAPMDHVMISTWFKPPSHNLPETSPSAFTYLINYYFDGD